MKNVAVIGSGTMGSGIAHTFAQHGYEVLLIDTNSQALERALKNIASNMDRQISKGSLTADEKNAALQRIKTSTLLTDITEETGLVIEAATENKDIKLNIFKQLDHICSSDIILASNTSSISITEIAAITQNAQRVVGMHFMNPVPLMKLVEVIRGKGTSDCVTTKVMDIARALEKVPVEVNDAPGFVANRILMPMINEAIYTLAEGVSGVTEIDLVMKLGMSHPMGPLQLADFIGLDVCLAIMNVLYDGFNAAKYAPCPLLVDMVAAGNMGIKSGLGFYDYSEKSKELRVSARFL
ncbi:3-hydroxybutyryl-CoA dehydrogenase [Mucilaginibacter auburnensis]|uniref:3-hydroxybutyryl-CoA dehydrogenase n=1 Tax=Mucilaginibacter auburnensis TaxID=1457233 RepID=A0A2H9VL46_9SPHI|nr:3-hydroxybutyryl-CoA dehydrogenase [Mucilaginibacter auburnensis]PJJ79067.1 3-hydroxybutyryl-CoA dehydrogenase [Mucilaginibacter auburnensis]